MATFLCLTPFQQWRFRGPVILRSVKGVVRLGLRDSLHESLKVTTIALHLEAVEVKNIGGGVVQEAGVVGHDMSILRVTINA